MTGSSLGFEARAGQVGEALRTSLTSALEALGLVGATNKALVQGLGITPVVATRLRKGLGAETPQGTLLALPGGKPLRECAARLRERGVEAARVLAFEASVEAFLEFVRDEAGDRRALETLLASHHPDGHESFERTRRQSAFRALRGAMGLFARRAVHTVILVPVQDGARTELWEVLGVYGLTRTRETATFHWTHEGPLDPSGCVGGLRLPGGSTPQGLDLGPAGRTAASWIRDTGQGALPAGHALAPGLAGAAAALDLVGCVRLTADGPNQVPALGEPRSVGFVPGLPLEACVVEVLVHQELPLRQRPELCLHSSLQRGWVNLADPGAATLRRPLRAGSRSLGRGLDSWVLTAEPQHSTAVSRVFAWKDWDPQAFECWRFEQAYPYLWNQISHCWFHPDDPLRS